MKLHFDILPKAQKDIYPHLKAIKDLDFTLFGGTALALQLGHRESIDFDFFTDKDITRLYPTLLHLNNINVAEIMQQIDNSLSFKTTNNVKFSFYGNIEFVKYSNKIQSDDGILQLADLKSLLITKLKVICDRAEYKDYKDIAEILKTKQISLENGLCAFSQYFGNDFPIAQIIKGLTYFEDGDLYRLNENDKKFLLNAVKNINIAKIENTTQNKPTHSQSKSHTIKPKPQSKQKNNGIEM